MCVHRASIGSDTSRHRPARSTIDADKEMVGPALSGIQRVVPKTSSASRGLGILVDQSAETIDP
jgi:hypothetical protein